MAARVAVRVGFNGAVMARADTRGTTRIIAALVAVGLAATSACAGGRVADAPAVIVPETVPIGGMPGPLSGTTIPTLPPVTVSTTAPTEPRSGRVIGPLVDDVRGHRVLLVGDTALAATTPRADGAMCDLVGDVGWDVQVEAEPGRPIEFADEVFDAVLEAPVPDARGDLPTRPRLGDWDVVGLMFGHHLTGSVDDVERTLDGLLDRLGHRPVILYTVAELGPEQVEVNRILRARQRSRPNVVVLDWAGEVATEADELLDGGGPTPSSEGAERLASLTVAMLGPVPGDGEDDGEDVDQGECLDARFTDDSAIVL